MARIVVVESGIASGKSTLLERLDLYTNIECYQEPLESWKKPYNFLGNFYSERKKYEGQENVLGDCSAIALQLKVLSTMMQRYDGIHERHAVNCLGGDGVHSVFIAERSIKSSRIFFENVGCRHEGLGQGYLQLANYLIDKYELAVEHIYLDVSF